MKLLVMVTNEIHDVALRQARELGKSATFPVGVLNAPLDDETKTWINRIWDSAEGAIQKAYREGIDAARPLIEKVSGLLAEMGTNLGKRADEVRSVIIQKLNIYLQTAIDGALGRVRPILSVGGRELKITRVTVEQRINLSTSLKASLAEVCEVAAEGEISLSAEYGA